jgi:hypothetical protein
MAKGSVPPKVITKYNDKAALKTQTGMKEYIKRAHLGTSDYVRCISNEDFETCLTVGKQYFVKEVWHDGGMYLIENDKGSEHTYFKDRFEIV